MNKFNLNQNGGWIEVDRMFNLPVNLFLDNMVTPRNKNEINIALLCEPQSVIQTSNYFITNKDNYDTILTYNQEVLDSCQNAEMFEFGSCWVYDDEINTNKKFEVSFLVGGKSFTEGHKLRHLLWNNQNKITIPKNFFNSSNLPYITDIESKKITNKKTPLFDSQFHLCIENTREKNYFSEKFIDCLFSKTIPIYWGCPNIGDWFNTDSIIIVNSLDEMYERVNALDKNFYFEKINSIEENYKKSLDFLFFHKRVCKKIEEIVKKYE